MTAKGSWVEIEDVVLRPEERVPTLPEDTRATPLLMRASGFLLEGAELGARVRIRTIIGRELEGRLRRELPSYGHGFGTTVPELLTIGTEAEA
jgi:hypothetical protein